MMCSRAMHSSEWCGGVRVMFLVRGVSKYLCLPESLY
jgi:hypothetical protein